MRLHRGLAILLVLLGWHAIYSQAAPQPYGFVAVNGRLRVNNKVTLIKQKRFYLFRGGRSENTDLIARLEAGGLKSRDCYYCGLKVSAAFMDWLHEGDGSCESPYCRAITDDDIAKVPEFKAAVDRGIKQFNKKPAIARRWLVTGLDPSLSSGFFATRKSYLNSVLKDIKPVAEALTDNGSSVQALFANVPLESADGTKKFLISNLIPVELGQKSYIWVCEVSVGTEKLVKQNLEAPDASKTSKNCQIIVHDLPKCDAGSCTQP
jgi:hypothetical protein